MGGRGERLGPSFFPTPMRKLLLGLGALGGLAAAGTAARRIAGRPDTAPSTNPLPSCPEGVPNCYRATRHFGLPSADVYQAAERAARHAPGALTGSLVGIKRDGLSFRARYAVGPLFKDELRVVVEGDELGSTLHVRSASDTPGWDAGVNRRRVEGLFDAMQRYLLGA